MLIKIKQLLRPPVFADEEDTRSASLMHTILLLLAGASFIVPLLLNLTALLDPNDEILFSASTLLMSLFIPALMLGLHQVMKRGRLRLAGAVMTGTLFILTTFIIISFRGIRDTGTGIYILVIALAGLLLGGQAAIIFTLLTIVVTLGIYYAETNDILKISLSETPEVVEWFILAVVVFLIGALLRVAFNSLNKALRQTREANQQLESIQQSLAERVAARTRDLELAAEIGRQISRVREPERMLSEAVELIRARFDLYYTQIYLVDYSRHNLVLRAGTGPVGQQLLKRGHRLPLSTTSINGTAAINNETLIITDTGDSPFFRLNPLLPETQSEMAVPLVISTDVVGVLNLQSNRPNALTEESLPAFEALAGQLAVAIDNARLFLEVTEARSVVEAQAQFLTRTGWESFLNALDRQEQVAYTFDLNRANFSDTPVQKDNGNSLSVPINIAGETLGKIEISGNEWYTWQDYDQVLLGSVAERVAQQIENLRLLADTEHYRLEAEDATRRLTREGWGTYLEKQKQATEGYIYDQRQVLPLSEITNGNGLTSGLVQSLTVRGESIGQFEVSGIPESEEDVSGLVEAVANRLSAHIENLRLAEQTEIALTEIEKRAEELSVINELARTVSQQLDLEQILETVYEQVRRVMPADAFIIGLYEPETNLIQYPLIYDEGQRYQESINSLSKETTIYQVLQTGEAYIGLYSSEK
jgi:GAF domain-containing protein